MNTLGSADHIMAAYPNDEEWAQACDALGRHGLIEAGNPLPRLTALGEAIFRPMSRQILPRQLPKYLLLKIESLPVVAASVDPPDPGTMRKAFVEQDRRLKQYSRERSPTREGEPPRTTDQGAG